MGRKKSKKLDPYKAKKTKPAAVKITLKPNSSVTITREGPDGQPITEEKELEGPERLFMIFLEKCIRAGFDLQQALSEIGAAITTIFQLGYIPSDDEFYELTPEQYEKYYTDVEQTDKKIFMLLSKNPMYQSSSREFEVLTEEQIAWFDKAQKVMKQYCRDAGKTFDNLEDELTWLTTVMPPTFSDGTRFRRNLLHEV
ncbi:MAG: hypothetical protein LBU17_04985 [Treponema sp.]|jgi:hypothetical protein|nr:hypothetical protein [Treponema sp.]